MGRVLVCGGRDYNNIPYLYGFLDCFHAQVGITHLLEGGATGADAAARMWAVARRIQFTTYPANWSKHGKAAGPIRNRAMLDEGKASVVIAFPGGVGTADMVTYARSKHIPVIRASGGLHD
jgi:predicted polyphosphate/ATP-dependent NAD kinase